MLVWLLSGPIHALYPNFRPIGCELSEKIDDIKKIKKPTASKIDTLAAATLRYADAAGSTKI
jgi:hypothetical protein